MSSVLVGAPTAGSADAGQPLFSLPGLCCAAAGGIAEEATAITAAWGLLQMAAHVLDTIEDGDLADQPWARHGPGAAINIATGLLMSVSSLLHTLEEDGTGAETVRAIQHDFHQFTLRICASQHADLTLRRPTLEQCWKVAEGKSGAFFALACRAGARLATTNARVIEDYSLFGHHLGMLIQIGDDISGLWSSAHGRGDLLAGDKWSLPIAYTMSVAAPTTRARLSACLSAAAHDPGAADEARQQVIESGALLYLTVEAHRHLQHGQAALQRAEPAVAASAALLALLRSCIVTNRTEISGSVNTPGSRRTVPTPGGTDHRAAPTSAA